MSCVCEPGVRIELPHPPWDCRMNPGWDEDERYCPSCGFNSIDPDCPDHGYLADIPEEAVA